MTAGSGALRHVVARRTHKERHQLASRQKLGLLEKHKDYSRRAKDYHKKEDQLNNLRQKAALRNKDEFYYRMTSSKQKQGDVIQSGAKLDRDQLKLVDTQDLRYVTSRRVIDEKKIEKMKKNLHLLDDFSGQHTIFVDSDDETEGKFDPAVYFDTDERLLGRASNRLTKEQLAKGGSRHIVKVRFRCSENTVVPVAASGIQGEASQQYSTLLSLQNRADKLKEVEAELELRKEVRSERGRRKKMVDADGRVVYKFRQERKLECCLRELSGEYSANWSRVGQRLERTAVGRSDWGFFECETTVEVDELSGCLAKVLTQYVLEHLPAEVQGRSTPFRLMELGAGLGIAGLAAAAAIPNGIDVLLTDGDDKQVRGARDFVQVVKSLNRTIVRNRHLTESPASTTIRAEVLVWGREFDPRYRYFFHQIICADVVYSRETHYSLQETIKRLLAPGGECWLFASRRLGSLEAFVDVCRSTADFEVVEVSADFRCQNPAMRELRAMRCSPVMVRIVKGSSVQDRSGNLYDDVVALRAGNLAAVCARDILRHKRASQLRSFLARRSRARALERGAVLEASRGSKGAAECKLELKDIDLERLSVRILSVPGGAVSVAWPSHLPGLSKAERFLIEWLCSRLGCDEFRGRSVLFSGPFRLAPFVLSESSGGARKVHVLPSAVEDAIALEKVCGQFRGAVKVKLSVRGKYDIVWSFDSEAARYVKRGGQLFLGRGDGEMTIGPPLGDWTSIDAVGMVVVCRGKRARVAAARRKGWASVVE